MLGQPLKYVAVGVVNTFLYASLLFVFLRYVEVSKLISVALAFLLAMCFQYSANRVFTFESGQKISKEIPRYLVAALFNYLITLLVVFVAIDYLLISDVLASIVASLITAVCGYLLALLWVYK